MVSFKADLQFGQFNNKAGYVPPDTRQNMQEPIWAKFLTDRDKAVLSASGYGNNAGFGKRPALLVIDVTYSFTGDRPEPILDSIKRWNNSCGAEGWQAVGVIRRLVDQCHAKNVPVIYSKGIFRRDGWDLGSWSWKNDRTREGKARNPSNVDGAAIVAEIAPTERDIVVEKQKPSAFFGSPLQSHLNLLGCDSVLVTGGTTSGCVRATVTDAFSLNLRASVVADACFDRCEASHAMSLCDMNAKYADIVDHAMVLEYLEALPSGLFALPGAGPLE